MPRDTSIFDEVTAKKRFKLPTGQDGIALLTLNSRGFLDSFDEAIILDRYSPVVQKRIGESYQKNIKISGIFRTSYEYSDDNPWGGYSFIQVRKNSVGRASAYCGYGVAWRPSVPDKNTEAIDIVSLTQDVERNGYWDIECADPGVETDDTLYLVQTNAEGRAIYTPFQHEGYSEGKLTGCYIAGIVPQDIDQIVRMAPNVYIVDNDPVHGDNYASKYIVDPLGGLSFIQAGTYLIERDKYYRFEITITETNALEFKLKEDNSEGDFTQVLTTGSAVPLSEYLGETNMDSLGLSVYDTNGYQWWYDDIKIEKLESEYAVMYFKMDVTGMPEMLQVEMTGAGSSPTDNGLKMEAWNVTTHKWVEILTYNGDNAETMLSRTIDKENYADGDLVTIRVRSLHGSSISAEASITVDSIKMIRCITPGIHIGGCVDVYIDDPSAHLMSEQITPGSNETSYNISSYPNVTNILSDTTELIYGVDYVIETGDPNTYNSTRANTILRVAASYAAAELTIVYWASDNLTDISASLSSDLYKPVATDILVKHKVIHEIDIDGYRQELYDYLDTLRYDNKVKTISYSDLVKYIYNASGVYASPKLIIHAFDGKKRRMAALTAMGQEYSINEIETFRVLES